MTRRGEVVLLRFPYADGTGGKIRPAVVVQCDRNNVRLQTTLVAMVTGNTSRTEAEPTQVLVDPATADGAGSGLHGRSAIKCETLFTVRTVDILRTIGSLTPTLQLQIDAALKSSLDLR